MKEINSYQINLSNQLTTKKIMDLYRFVINSSHDIYLYQDGQIADGGNCPKLLSFFLVASIQEPVVIIIDGENPAEIYEDIKHLINTDVKHSQVRNRLKGTSSTSFVV